MIGFLLCGIAEEPFCPVPEGLLDLANLAALQMAQFGRDRLDCRARRRDGVEELRVTVPGDHLARRGRCQPQRRADVRFDGGFDV